MVENGTLPEIQNGGKEMPEIVCVGCGNEHLLIHHGYEWGGNRNPGGAIRGVLTCHRPIDPNNLRSENCNSQTLFELTPNAITFYPGKGAYGELSSNMPKEVTDRFVDAQLCYYGTGFRGSVAMCRSAVEKALVIKGYTQGMLEEKIDEARKNGILTDRERMLAHGSRLVGNDALHLEDDIDPAAIPSVLSAVVSICNHLYP